MAAAERWRAPLVVTAAVLRAAAAAAAAPAAACDFQRLDGRLVDNETVAAARRPLVLTGLLDHWPARAKWSTAKAFAALHGSASGYARDHDQL
mmetsp:Transcript_53812/g.172527  ORF Transcript_53812/g.172527 Transcript_53812/m.172527 type:complete len:93 (-) Transcript_53812:6-284(-)